MLEVDGTLEAMMKINNDNIYWGLTMCQARKKSPICFIFSTYIGLI